MTIISEISFEDFCPWSGAVSTYERICKEGKAEAFEQIVEDLYPDGLTETNLNDLLWFEPETCFEWVGIRSYDMILNDLKAAREELEEASRHLSELDNECFEKMLEVDTEEEKEEIRNSYSSEIDEIAEEIEEIEYRLGKLNKELEKA